MARKRNVPLEEKSQRKRQQSKKRSYNYKVSPASHLRQQMVLLSPNMRTTLKYSDNGQLNPGAVGAMAIWTFRANSVFDPDFTGVGHQPRGFDQLMALYDHYTVMASKIIVTFLQGGSSVNSNIVGVALLEDSTSLSLLYDYIESREVAYQGLSASAVGCGDTKIIRKNFNSAMFMGRPDPASEDNLRGTSSTNLADQAFFHIFVGPTYSVDSASVDVQVTLFYDVLFSEPKNPSSS